MPTIRSPIRGQRRGAFTIMELTFSIAVIFLIMGLLLAGMRYATRAAKGTVAATTLNSLKVSVDQFRKETGFIPALVKDLNSPAPVVGNPPNKRPVVYEVSVPADLAFLRGATITQPIDPDLRFTIYGLAYYIIGALPDDVDGRAGAGFMMPTPDGGFSRKGRKFDPFFDTSRNAQAVQEVNAAKSYVELRDTNNVAYRYYRWLPDTGTPASGQPINQFYNVPVLVGDPETNLDLRSAEWAIVGAGRDGLFGDEHIFTIYSIKHPQALQQDEVESRLGMPASTPIEVMKKASADNIVVIGGTK